ncbi:MAG: hypothetical protein A3C70_01735 [Candidatus Zambryskibacteria bacterium RIFCSPHIGHO2_02_FULL_43_14]|uniref:NAD-dependent epimerase/dehydratase domain-containing protein n=1 Tax=Candidatus Zambryskibacteria bacterium RIFCSPHIGHO2_02_FULL_43_14 TaxID=1802748 RepID=A0A1G2TID6_9BACT|nr:MAG: hypothetical protein A2829_01560 [Candidatus Zambryskibacteria bacterium RIFCSPHIGHO2_01_FULL_43_60]OHA96962.1 MAG: hypothetical protein A3C70_01735 [Candidatus Zambryskibacteria bacterium RIFCSPHIGHO2_02_FULL_43_14]OHB03984.1 MAG: hypothetical protein A3B03_00800 [Candidatus Zambryskibacteria bacterium RIFCSPLOWO2_01_FULL_42_41]
MNILIAGAAGFIGSNLSDKLLKDGHKVWAVDNFTTGKSENLESFKDNKNFIFAECGVETEDFLKFCSDQRVKFDQIFDLACPTGVPNIEILGDEMLEACSNGTKNILRVAHEHNARFLFTSSSEIYGEPEVPVQSENYTGNVDPIGWRANYEEGKRFSETLIMHAVRKHKLNARIVRLFNVYGPNMALGDFRVIPTFITQALVNKPLTVHGAGTQIRTMCFVDDLINGLILVMEKGIAGEAYNLGSDKAISMLDLAKEIILATESESDITFIPRAEHDHNSRMPVLDKVRALGWDYKVDLRTGLGITIDNFRKRITAYDVKYSIDESLQLQPQG